jgi:predicted helicase
MGDPAPGFLTTQDEFAISFGKDEAAKKVAAFLATSDEKEARRLFRLCSQDQWSFERAKKELPDIDLSHSIVNVNYRPFDERWTVWDRNVAVHRRERVNKHLLNENIALLTTKITKDAASVFISSKPAAHKSSSTYDISYVFPLYLTADEHRENLGSDFREYIDTLYEHHYSAEEIFGYVYAVLHSQTYRARYAEFLRIDFPRVPFPESSDDFEALSGLGWALVQAHLLRELPRRGLAAYHGTGDHMVEIVRYLPEEQTISINKTQCFKPVPPAVWEFHIGGYQVLDKYLKSRKDRTLSLDEINHVAAIADSLDFTIEQMVKIDKAYTAAFPNRG